MTEIYRKLGLHDRYSLSRSLIGFPPVVAIVSTLILPDQGSIEEELSKVQDLLSSRISKLLEIVPFLSARVSDHQSMEPKWVKSETILTSKDILHLNLIEDQVGVGLEEICSKQLEVGIKTLMPSQKGPLWRVDIHHRLDSRLISIGLSVNHTLADGKGSFNLYQLLISPPFDLSRDLTQTQVEMIRGVKVFPDPSDVSCMRSDWEKPLTKTSESISSASSKKDQDPVAESECWPYTIEKRIKDCQPDLILIQLKRKGILKDLKDNCIKLGSIKTFHAAIHSSIIVGILSLNLMENPSRIKGDGYGIENSSRDKIGLKSATPINIRKGEFGLIVGNFVGVSEWQGQFDPSSLFWKVTKEHDKELNSVEGRKKALSFIGMLDNMPDSIKENPDGTKKTGWEIYLDSKDSYADSFSLSNLGKFSLEPPSSSTNPIKISSLAWCQTPSISSAALAVDVCGLSEDENENGERGGLSISIGFREGTLSREAVKKVAEVVKKTLNDLSEGKIGKDTTFWDLSRSG